MNLTNNSQLFYLDVDENDLTELDLGNNPNLAYLLCEFNPNLSFINIKSGNTQGLGFFRAEEIANNACVQVDDAQAATDATTSPYNQWVIDTSSYFSEDCLLSTISFTDEKLVFFPNPTLDKVTILSQEITSFKIYDSKGRVVIGNTTFNDNTIDVAFLKSGIYFIKAYNNKNESQNIKFIKK